MISDDERREVAQRLRELDYSDLQESLICAYLDALGIEGYEDLVGIAHRLADLIEPPTQCPYYHSDRHYCSIHDVPAMDRDALIELAEGLECKADDIIRAAKHAQFSGFGPSMGEAEHDAYEWRCIAHRIREALGVDDGR